jgi:hypothetical protein
MSKNKYKSDEQILKEANMRIMARKVRLMMTDFLRTPTTEKLDVLKTELTNFIGV